MTALENVEIKLLTGCSDIFSGITVDEELLAKTSALFERQLEQSLVVWREAKRRGIWLRIPHDRTELIPIAQKFGFVLRLDTNALQRHRTHSVWLSQKSWFFLSSPTSREVFYAVTSLCLHCGASSA